MLQDDLIARAPIKNNVYDMSSCTEAKLKDTSYSRDKRRCDFEKYVKTHVNQHSILTGIVKHGYYGIDDRSKVCHVMAGIKTKVLDPVKTQIMASAALQNDFEACVNLYKDFIEQCDNLGVWDANISLVHSKKNGAPSGSGGRKNMSGHALMGRPAGRLDTMVLVFSSYVLVCFVDKRR